MRFRVLGPVTVAPRTPTAAKVRVVLAVLLVRANETVSTESLIDELWDNSPPRTAGTTLQVYISQLRRILLEGDPAAGAHGRQLLTLPPGYCLQVAQDDLDLTRFEALHRAGKAAGAEVMTKRPHILSAHIKESVQVLLTPNVNTAADELNGLATRADRRIDGPRGCRLGRTVAPGQYQSADRACHRLSEPFQ